MCVCVPGFEFCLFKKKGNRANTTNSNQTLRVEIKSSFFSRISQLISNSTTEHTHRRHDTTFVLRKVVIVYNEWCLLYTYALTSVYMYTRNLITQTIAWRSFVDGGWMFELLLLKRKIQNPKSWCKMKTDSTSFFSGRLGRSHRLSGSSPSSPRRCLSLSQSRTVWPTPLCTNQDVSSLLDPSEGLLWLGHLTNQARCCFSASMHTNSRTIWDANCVSPTPFMKAILADSLSM